MSNEPLTFTSVRDLGGLSHQVISTFFQVMRAHERAIRPDLDDLTEEMVRADLESPYADLDQSGQWLRNGQPVIVAIVTIDRASRNVGIDAYGLPGLPVDDFIPLFDQGIAFARTIAEADQKALDADQIESDLFQPDPRIWQIQMFCREEDAGYREFLKRVGLRHVRNFYRMTVDLQPAHDEMEDFPQVALVPAVTEDLQRELKEVSTTAFEAHWGSTGVTRTFEEWKAMRESSPGFAWERAYLVRLDGANAGLLICTDLLAHESTDYIWTLGVLKEFRGRGIASWLLRRAFHEARALGRAKSALNVDAENSTGAVRLYEAVGMRPTEVYVAYRAPIT